MVTEQRPEVIRMGEWLKCKLEQFTDFETEFIEEDQESDLPPVIKGRSRIDDPNKKTVFIYCHYDVMPVCLFLLVLTCIDI